MIPSGSPIPGRQQRLLDELERAGLDTVVLNAGPSLTYLTGLDVHLSERPILAVFRPDGMPVLVAPSLEKGKLEKLAFDARLHVYGEDPSTWPAIFRHAAEEAELDYRRVGVEPLRFRVLELRLLENAAPRAAFMDGAEVISVLRRRKDADEIERIRAAVRVAEEALTSILESLVPGVTEKAFASALTAQLLACGSAPELPFSPIVAFGESTANPHAVPTDRPLQPGDLVLVDWGANVDGYASDLTRMFSYGRPEPELTKITEIVAAANEAARSIARPGVCTGDVDRAARAVIEQAGYGPQFIHRTGHGLGLETHEMPFIRSGDDVTLETGMTFTTEPGIYLPGRGGARIEDDVVVTEAGLETISTLDRRLVDLSELNRGAKK